jgi:DNA-binding NtrC family response regulator
MVREPLKIVIVDDEEDLCFLLAKILRTHGYEVNSYFTLKSGLAGIASQKPDWVIIDNNLPDGLGWDHASDILETSPDLHLINISANPDSERNDISSRIHYLIKPVDVNSIVKLIRKQEMA